MSTSELSVLKFFQRFLITPGKMLCFDSANLKKYESSFQKLTANGMLVKERFQGGYSLTRTGFAAMKDCV